MKNINLQPVSGGRKFNIEVSLLQHLLSEAYDNNIQGIFEIEEGDDADLTGDLDITFKNCQELLCLLGELSANGETSKKTLSRFIQLISSPIYESSL